VTTLWHIQLETTDKGVKLVRDNIELNRLESAESNNIVLFGQLLSNMELYYHSKRHFEYLLNNYSESYLNALNIRKETILFHIDRSHDLRGRLSEAYSYYKQTLDIQMNTQPLLNRKDIARTLNNIGSIYHSRNMFK
ncbi:unnamed protein product, partial [Didymodactylos carnosus]